jgi:hypothetical protein
MNTKTSQNINVSVDEYKYQVDIYIHFLGIYFAISNDGSGWRGWTVPTISVKT